MLCECLVFIKEFFYFERFYRNSLVSGIWLDPSSGRWQVSELRCGGRLNVQVEALNFPLSPRLLK